MRVAIYSRLSDDQSGRSTGIERQIEACRQFAAARDWEVVAEFRDADLSAFRVGVVRPEYEKMLERLGEFDAVVVWKLDRLVRRFLEFARLWPMFSAQNVALVSATEPIDTSNAIGRIIVLILVGFAELESETISLRSRAKHDELRRLGKRSGGHRAFGHNADWADIVPSEAALIREAVKRVTGGESVYAIVKDWHRRGEQSLKGRRWDAKTLRDLLLQERLIGERGGVGGQIAPILRRAEWDRARSVLLSRPRSPGATARKYLLSGFLYCAKCEVRMKAHRHAAGLRYRCPECFTSIMAAPVEKMLVEGVLTLVENTDMPEERDEDSTAILETISEDEQALADLSRARYVERSITEGEFRAARDELVTRIEQGRKRYLARAPSAEYDRKEVRSLWGKADLSWRRQVFGSVIEKVKVKKATRLGRFFDPSRVEVSWLS